MIEAVIGLTVGGVVTVLAALAVHTIREYGKREGIVQGGQSICTANTDAPVPTEEEGAVEAVYEKHETE